MNWPQMTLVGHRCIVAAVRVCHAKRSRNHAFPRICIATDIFMNGFISLSALPVLTYEF